jgi:hypothetical protein
MVDLCMKHTAKVLEAETKGTVRYQRLALDGQVNEPRPLCDARAPKVSLAADRQCTYLTLGRPNESGGTL